MKKIKDTKIGAFLKDKAPNVLNIVGDLLPDAGALGVIKNIIDMSVPDAKDKSVLLAEMQSMETEYLKDVQNARDMYKSTGHSKADKIADSVITWNLWIIMALVIAMSLVIMFIDGSVSAVISGLIGTAIGNLFQERNTIIGFFFGSSQGSKDKDK